MLTLLGSTSAKAVLKTLVKLTLRHVLWQSSEIITFRSVLTTFYVSKILVAVPDINWSLRGIPNHDKLVQISYTHGMSGKEEETS